MQPKATLVFRLLPEVTLLSGFSFFQSDIGYN